MVQRFEIDWYENNSGGGGIEPTPVPSTPPASEIGQPIVSAELPLLPPELLATNPISTPIQIPATDNPVINNLIAEQAQTFTEREYVTFQVATEGFGSYLEGILPEEIAVTAGAFGASMQQVKNILNVDFEKFAQVAFAIETTKGLNLVNGTNVPVDVELANQGYKITALGSGPYGTYTMSDFFGCMSGLPYPWKSLYEGIIDLQTTKLRNIYEELYLAVSWEKAYCTITTNPYYVNVQHYIAPDPSAIPPVAGQPRIDQLWYTVTITQGDIGGGYGRGGATTPAVALSPNNCGASVSTSIDTNTADIGTTYGRVTFSINNGSAFNYGTATNSSNDNPPNQSSGPYAPPVESIQVSAPPIDTLAVQSNGSKSTSGSNATGDIYYSVGSPLVTVTGWPSPMNSVVAAYIAQADAEVAVIRTTQPIKATNLNALYDQMGAQLSYEQRARFTGIGPVPTGTRDRFLNAYPSSLMVFVDSLQELSKNTLPHMQVQTLEAISNLDLTGGQSIIGAMRESRNTARLDAIGVAQDNVIDGTIQEAQEIELLLNGTLLTSIPPTDVPSPIVDPYVFNSSVPIKFTPPALAEPAPEPLGYFDGTNIIATTEVTPGNPSILLPSNQPVLAQQLASLATNPNAPFPTNQISQANQVYPTVGTLVPAGQGKVLDVGKAPPGSLAPSKAINLLPPNLKFAAGTVLPSTFSVPEAIDEVIKCNCDCWVQ